jgi:hypothetical protein
MSDEIDADAPVWISTGFSGDTSAKCLRVDPDCRQLGSAKQVAKKTRRMYPADQRVCDICTGRYEPHGDYGRSDAYLALTEGTDD